MRTCWRDIRVLTLLGQTAAYRMFNICCTTLLLFLFTGDVLVAFQFSVAWGVVEFCLYFAFHYVWARSFKLGKNGKEGGLEWHVRQQQKCKPS